MYAAFMPSRADTQVLSSFQSNAGALDRDARRKGSPRARNRSATRRPVFPLPPTINVFHAVFIEGLLPFGRRPIPCTFAWLHAFMLHIIASMQWDDVRLFLALHRARTVGAAARALGVDPSTVSRRLGALEETLAATLFDRGREGIAPTEAAERLLPVAEEIEAAMTRFTTAAEGLEREVSGRVRITCPPDVAEVVLVPLLPGLLARHPSLSVDLEPGEATLDLTRREADLALRTVRPLRGDLVVRRLRDVVWVVAAAPGLARELGTLRRWTEA